MFGIKPLVNETISLSIELIFFASVMALAFRLASKTHHWKTVKLCDGESCSLTKELIFSKERAEEADRLKTAFLSNLSHEVRTPLNAIVGFSQLLNDEYTSPEKRDYYVKVINQSSKYLLNIINDILDIAKIESGNMKIMEKPGSLKEMLDETLEMFRAQNELSTPKSIEIIINNQVVRNCDKIITDFTRVRQTLTNLLNNAYRFTDNGTIEVGCQIQNENKLLFYVRDSGIGIPKNMQQAIFDRFRQVDDKHLSPRAGGTGLGLSISKGIVELLGGKIWVESELGRGSVFYFTITLKKADATESVPDQPAAALPEWKDKKILVVEDEFDNAQLLDDMLEHSKANVIHASDGLSAIKQFRDNEDIRVVLMDIRLPDIDGIEVTKKIKAMKQNVIVIAQTAFADNEMREKCFESGFNDIITKPVSRETLFQKLKTYME
jgi:signal transduction histidine kinase/CheY-like chemotaxis protein